HRDADVRVVLVGEIVQVDDLRTSGPQNRGEVLDHHSFSWVLYLGAGEAELDLAGVLPDIGGLPLLDQAHLLHFLVRVLPVDTGARAPRSVGDHHAGETAVLAAEALGDPVIRHDLDVVLVGGDAEMCRAGQGGFGGGPVGDEEVGSRVMEFHHFFS